MSSIIGNRTPLSDRSATSGNSTPAPSRSTSIFQAPAWVQTFYAKFPLVVFDQEDEPSWKASYEGSGALWIAPPGASGENPHHRPWASASPSSLRVQLLFLLRHVHVTFRPWYNEHAAPEGSLPALHTIGDGEKEQLLSTDQIRGWLDTKYPLKGKNRELQGMPNQEAYDRGVALARLVLGHLLPAYLISISGSSSSSSSRSSFSHLLFPNPPPLVAGLKTPLPAALTGDARDIDRQEILAKGLDALDAVHLAIQGDWALGAKHPTPLDALLASHLYPIFSLSATESVLAGHIQSIPEIGDYVDRVLSVAGAHVK